MIIYLRLFLNCPPLNVTLVHFIMNLKAATKKQHMFNVITTPFNEYFSEKSSKNPKNEDKTISNGEVITCRISKTYYNSYGYLKPYIAGELLDFYYYQILSIIGSSESILLISFSTKISLIFVDLALRNIFFNLFYFYDYESCNEISYYLLLLLVLT